MFSAVPPSTIPRSRSGQNKIVGGEDARPGQFPYQLGLYDVSGIPNEFLCGAIVYATDTMITAANCNLQYASVPIVDDETCRSFYGASAIADSMICAGDGNETTCKGDGGGPMTCGDYLCGITSFGYECNKFGYPGSHAIAGIEKDSDSQIKAGENAL
ncbi:hypothetical protein HAZT_HAZT005486 [Hyalella azteca]|uniref:Peptidase S1 domain-containing protein n=1 Tax=Hyalella azteca TaxID=294128 RepID=A0A6A0GST8_HYAAZ|nr:hypothetical protein HAZT_HAZT005486 [Hyalella azteca]